MRLANLFSEGKVAARFVWVNLFLNDTEPLPRRPHRRATRVAVTASFGPPSQQKQEPMKHLRHTRSHPFKRRSARGGTLQIPMRPVTPLVDKPMNRRPPFMAWFSAWRQVTRDAAVRLMFIHCHVPFWARREATERLQANLREAGRWLTQHELQRAVAVLSTRITRPAPLAARIESSTGPRAPAASRLRVGRTR